MVLAPEAQGGAELTFGSIDSTKFTGALTYAPLPSDSAPGWTLSSPGLFVNGQSAPALARNRTVIFDSGTSNVLLDNATALAVYALISPAIQPFAPLPGAFGIPCKDITALAASIDIAFVDEGGRPFNLTIPSGELSVGPFAEDPETCQTLINV